MMKMIASLLFAASVYAASQHDIDFEKIAKRYLNDSIANGRSADLRMPSPRAQLKFAKDVDPTIFHDASPRFHLTLLEHFDKPAERKSAVVFRGGAKTTLLNKIKILARIFFLHEKYTMIVSESERKAKQFLRNLKTAVNRAQAKGYDIGRGAVWSDTSVQIITGGVKCQVDAMATGQDPRGYITDDNFRPTLLVLDDIETKEKMKSRDYREKVGHWLTADLFPGLDTNGEIWLLGTITHIDGIVNRTLLSSDWESIRIPILNDSGGSNWPSRFPTEKIYAAKKRLYADGLYDTFANEYLCIAQAEEKKYFKREMMRYFDRVSYESDTFVTLKLENAVDDWKVDVKKPRAVVLDDGQEIPVAAMYCYATNDIASDGKDRTAIVTVYYDTLGNWYIADIKAGRWNPFRKSVAAIETQVTYDPLQFGIEKGGMQNDFFYTIDVAQKETRRFDGDEEIGKGIYINVAPLKHGNVEKNIRISHLHPYFTAQQIYLNRSHPMTPVLEAQLTSFDIDKESPEDDLMDALAYQVQFVAGRGFERHDDSDWNRGSLWNRRKK